MSKDNLEFITILSIFYECDAEIKSNALFKQLLLVNKKASL